MVSVNDELNMKLGKLKEILEEREAWHAVPRLTKSRARMGDSTTTLFPLFILV